VTNNGADGIIEDFPTDARERLDADVAAAGGAWVADEEEQDAIGRTMFDSPQSEDNSVTVLLPNEHLQSLPSQALARIVSKPDRRE
jgi:hypothetical protein